MEGLDISSIYLYHLHFVKFITERKSSLPVSSPLCGLSTTTPSIQTFVAVSMMQAQIVNNPAIFLLLEESCKNKMGVQIIIFHFHCFINKVIRLYDYINMIFSTKVEN
jgi:hypothetical protein